MWANHPFRWNSLAAEGPSVIGGAPEPRNLVDEGFAPMIGDGTHLQLSDNWLGVPRKNPRGCVMVAKPQNEAGTATD